MLAMKTKVKSRRYREKKVCRKYLSGRGLRFEGRGSSFSCNDPHDELPMDVEADDRPARLSETPFMVDDEALVGRTSMIA